MAALIKYNEYLFRLVASQWAQKLTYLPRQKLSHFAQKTRYIVCWLSSRINDHKITDALGKHPLRGQLNASVKSNTLTTKLFFSQITSKRKPWQKCDDWSWQSISFFPLETRSQLTKRAIEEPSSKLLIRIFYHWSPDEGVWFDFVFIFFSLRCPRHHLYQVQQHLPHIRYKLEDKQKTMSSS